MTFSCNCKRSVVLYMMKGASCKGGHSFKISEALILLKISEALILLKSVNTVNDVTVAPSSLITGPCQKIRKLKHETGG